MRRLVFSLLLLPAGLSAQTLGTVAQGVTGLVAVPEQVDLSGQFPTAADRNQGNTGSCHVFSSISLLEAALYRRWTLRHVLSEADLFVRRIVKNPAYYSQVKKAIKTGPGISPAYELVEGGSVLEDLKFALANGVVKETTAPWDAFAKRYAAFESAQRAAIDKGSSQVEMTDNALEGINKDLERVGSSAVGADRTADIQRTYMQRVQMNVTRMNINARLDFAGFLAQIEGKTEAEAESLLLGTDPQLAKDRTAYKALLAGFGAAALDFDLASSTNTPARCRALGVDRKKALWGFFMKGVPVSVTMDLDGLPEWGTHKGRSMHAFTVTGYTASVDPEGGLILTSRNSWGGKNPGVDETRFCRIKRAIYVLTDQERAK